MSRDRCCRLLRYDSLRHSGAAEFVDSIQPAGQWVPSGENLGHHPSLAFRPASDGKPSFTFEASRPRSVRGRVRPDALRARRVRSLRPALTPASRGISLRSATVALACLVEPFENFVMRVFGRDDLTMPVSHAAGAPRVARKRHIREQTGAHRHRRDCAIENAGCFGDSGVLTGRAVFASLR